MVPRPIDRIEEWRTLIRPLQVGAVARGTRLRVQRRAVRPGERRRRFIRRTAPAGNQRRDGRRCDESKGAPVRAHSTVATATALKTPPGAHEDLRLPQSLCGQATRAQGRRELLEVIVGPGALVRAAKPIARRLDGQSGFDHKRSVASVRACRCGAPARPRHRSSALVRFRARPGSREVCASGASGPRIPRRWPPSRLST